MVLLVPAFATISDDLRWTLETHMRGGGGSPSTMTSDLYKCDALKKKLVRMWFKISDPKWIRGEKSLGLGCSFVDTTLSVNHKRKYCWIIVPNISHFCCLLDTTMLSSDKLKIGKKISKTHTIWKVLIYIMNAFKEPIMFSSKRWVGRLTSVFLALGCQKQMDRIPG